MGTGTELGAEGVGDTTLLVGVAVAFVSGLVAIKTVLVVVQLGRLAWFAVYCWAIALGTLVWLALR